MLKLAARGVLSTAVVVFSVRLGILNAAPQVTDTAPFCFGHQNKFQNTQASLIWTV